MPVATDVGDARKIIGSTGFILNGHSVEILQNELSKIMKIKKKTIESMGRKARNRAKKLFTVRNMVKSYDNIFLQVK